MPGKNSLWDFSTTVYGRDGVAPACLRLQDDHGADVNIIMYCTWIAWDHAMTLDAAAVGRIVSEVEPWKERVVEPLRVIRRDLKSATHQGIEGKAQERLRTEIKRVELRSERLQQDMLHAMSRSGLGVEEEDKRGTALENILQYLQTLPSEIDDAARRDAELIVAATFDG